MPLVSVCCVTYNHADFIKQTLEGFVTQKTNFPFEVIIADDCSTDGQQDIIKEYAKKYPDIIKPIFHSHNTGSYQNLLDAASACKGKYVAMCDGDDYWTDENKLQKQADFMDTHKDCSICFHPVLIKYEDGSQKNVIFPKSRHHIYKKTLNINDLLKYNFIQTNSVMYRWVFNDKNSIEDILHKNILPVDYYLHLLHASKGKICFLPDVMAVYRKHVNGIWYGVNLLDKWFLNYGIEHLCFYESVEKYFGADKSKEKIHMVRNTALASLRNNDKETLNKLLNLYPQILKTAFAENKGAVSKIRHTINKFKQRFTGFMPFII